MMASLRDLVTATLRCGLLLGLGVVMLVMSTASMAAEYDPSSCPDAARAVANIRVAIGDPEPPVLKAPQPPVDIVCTLCCHPPYAGEALTPPDPAEPLPGLALVAGLDTRDPGSLPIPMLRPPRA